MRDKPLMLAPRLALAATLFAMIVIMLGAFTRLADAGLGCPDWPGCYGHALWPDDAQEIAAANEAFPSAPVDINKTWPEMIHRYLASCLGLFAIALAYFSIRHRQPNKPLKLPLFLLGFIILQGLFGMWTVTLKLWPQVVTGHLLGGFITLNLFWLLTLRLYQWPIIKVAISPKVKSKLIKLSSFVLALVVVQIVLGGWTTSNYAAVACPDLPQCQGQWLPPMDFSSGFNIFQHMGPNYLGGLMDNASRVAIHMSHRLGAIVAGLALFSLIIALFKASLKPLALLIAGVTLAQLTLGISNVAFHFPVAVAVAHNLGGVLLAASLVFTLYGLYTARHEQIVE